MRGFKLQTQNLSLCPSHLGSLNYSLEAPSSELRPSKSWRSMMAGRQAAAFPPTDTHTARCSVLSIPPRAPLLGLGTCLGGLPQPVGHHAVAESLVLSSVAIESCCPWLELPVPDTGSMSSTTNSSFPFSLFCPGPWRFHSLMQYV